MQRYFIKDENFYENSAHIKEDYHHIKNVMRSKIGDKVIICLNDGRSFLSTITNFFDDYVEVLVIESLDSREVDFDLTVAVGLMNNNKMEFIIQKLTELGVSRIIPLNMTRSIVKDKDKKQERFKKIAKEAAEQSHRSIIPVISKTMNIKDLDLDNDLNLFAYEGSDNFLKSNFEIIKTSKSILIIIGPEGGFDLKEVNYLKEKEFKEISLGKRILRAETACLAAASSIILIKEQL